MNGNIMVKIVSYLVPELDAYLLTIFSNHFVLDDESGW